VYFLLPREAGRFEDLGLETLLDSSVCLDDDLGSSFIAEISGFSDSMSCPLLDIAVPAGEDF
jgi:hypothetical protein